MNFKLVIYPQHLPTNNLCSKTFFKIQNTFLSSICSNTLSFHSSSHSVNTSFLPSLRSPKLPHHFSGREEDAQSFPSFPLPPPSLFWANPAVVMVTREEKSWGEKWLSLPHERESGRVQCRPLHTPTNSYNVWTKGLFENRYQYTFSRGVEGWNVSVV